MPLRPVAELGLVDLTDLPAQGARSQASGRKSTGRATPSRTPARAAKQRRTTPDSKPASGKSTRRRSAPTTSEARAATPDDRVQTGRMPPEVARIGIPLLSGIAAVAGGLLVARTALRR